MVGFKQDYYSFSFCCLWTKCIRCCFYYFFKN